MTIEDERQEPREEGVPEGDGQEVPGASESQAPEDQPGTPTASEGEAPGDQSGSPDTEDEAPGAEGPDSAPEADAQTPDADEPDADEPTPAKPQAEAEAGGEGAGDAPEQPPPDDSDADPKRPARARERRGGAGEGGAGEQPEVVPGADLEPDLVLDDPARQEDQFETAAAERYAEPEPEATADEALPTAPEEAPGAAEPAPLAPRDLAADARYQATGKRKTAVARVILKPGGGNYTVNGRTLEQFFPRHGLQATARQPLAAAGYESRMDVVARLHGGGVSSQAGALRHGVARALVEADPALREELKRRGYLTRDPRAKERKKAGLKKARKRPQFSKR